MKYVCVAISLFVLLATSFAADKPRVFITDSKSWEMAGGGGGTSGGFGTGVQGGARPQTAEIIKTFGERCPDVTVNNKQDRAGYVILLDHEGGKGLVRKDNKVVVFNGDGDSILSHSTRSLGNSVKDACEAIIKDWSARGSRAAGSAVTTEPAPPAQSAAVAADAKAAAELEVASTPSGAEVEVDGNFVGSTPSTLGVAAGQHQIVIKKSGFKPWERKITTSTGHVKINAELEAEAKQ
jgi:hypothetical protein